ncbi:MAG: response regulator [Nitrosopumilus sp.]|nr:response regulator [Nitrosopumilus sp.]
MVRIIIIDDDIEQVESIKFLMKLKKIEVSVVGYNGKDVVELYKKYKPDVVLLDLMMPEYDGYYAIEEITK